MAEKKKEVDPVAAAYGAIGIPTGRISNLSWEPSASRAALTGLSRSNAPVLNGIGNKQISHALEHYASEMKEDPQFAVGKYNNEYPDYRKVTAAEWKNPTFQAQLVEAHQAYRGWPLLEEPLECNDFLCVAEGYVQIEGALVAEVGSNGRSTQQLRGVYPAMNRDTKVAWTTTAPALGDNWTVLPMYGHQSGPCLFVHESYNPVPGMPVFR